MYQDDPNLPSSRGVGYPALHPGSVGVVPGTGPQSAYLSQVPLTSSRSVGGVGPSDYLQHQPPGGPNSVGSASGGAYHGSTGRSPNPAGSYLNPSPQQPGVGPGSNQPGSVGTPGGGMYNPSPHHIPAQSPQQQMYQHPQSPGGVVLQRQISAGVGVGTGGHAHGPRTPGQLSTGVGLPPGGPAMIGVRGIGPGPSSYGPSPSSSSVHSASTGNVIQKSPPPGQNPAVTGAAVSSAHGAPTSMSTSLASGGTALVVTAGGAGAGLSTNQLKKTINIQTICPILTQLENIDTCSLLTLCKLGRDLTQEIVSKTIDFERKVAELATLKSDKRAELYDQFLVHQRALKTLLNRLDQIHDRVLREKSKLPEPVLEPVDFIPFAGEPVDSRVKEIADRAMNSEAYRLTLEKHNNVKKTLQAKTLEVKELLDFLLEFDTELNVMLNFKETANNHLSGRSKDAKDIAGK